MPASAEQLSIWEQELCDLCNWMHAHVEEVSPGRYWLRRRVLSFLLKRYGSTMPQPRPFDEAFSREPQHVGDCDLVSLPSELALLDRPRSNDIGFEVVVKNPPLAKVVTPTTYPREQVAVFRELCATMGIDEATRVFTGLVGHDPADWLVNTVRADQTLMESGDAPPADGPLESEDDVLAILNGKS